MNGWIKIHRQILGWRWYDDSLTVHLFLHCIINAAVEDHEWHNTTIKRGQFATTIATLAKELKATPQKIRSRIERLQADNAIALKSTNKFTIVTICNYDTYQSQTTNEQQTNNKQTTNEQKENFPPTPPLKENNNNNKYSSSSSISAHAHEGFIEALKCDRTWGEMIAMRYSLSSLEALDTWLDKFSLDHQCRGIVHDNISDAKRHFNDWLRIQLQIIKRNESEIDTKNRRRYLEVTATTEKDYSTTFQVERLP